MEKDDVGMTVIEDALEQGRPKTSKFILNADALRNEIMSKKEDVYRSLESMITTLQWDNMEDTVYETFNDVPKITDEQWREYSSLDYQ